MKFDIFQWLDIVKLEPVYGVRVKAPGKGWRYIAEGGHACLFRDRGEAEMFRDFVRFSATV